MGLLTAAFHILDRYPGFLVSTSHRRVCFCPWLHSPLLTFLLSFCTSPFEPFLLVTLLTSMRSCGCSSLVPLRQWSDCGVALKLSAFLLAHPTASFYSVLLWHYMCCGFRHHGERNYASPSQSGCRNSTLVWLKKILSAVASFCSSSSVCQDQSSTGMEDFITSAHPFLPWFLGTSCGSFRPYIIDCQSGQTFLLLQSDLLCHFSETAS